LTAKAVGELVSSDRALETSLTLGLVCQEARSSLLNLWVRERLVSHTLLDRSPGKHRLRGLLESKRRRGAKQPAEEVKELHSELDRLEAAAKGPGSQSLVFRLYLNIFLGDGIAALGPRRFTTRRRRKLRAPEYPRVNEPT
jgi:hypothetical protein